MKKIEDYWTVSNVTGGRRKYTTKQLALDSLGRKHRRRKGIHKF